MDLPQTLYAKLVSIPEVAAIVNGAIYPDKLPETHDLVRDGPAISFTIVSYPRNHVLAGSDGTATATVQLSAWSTSEAVSDSIALALLNALDGPPVNPWGDGTLQIRSVIHLNEVDVPNDPDVGTDQWIYQVASDYEISHWVTIPTLT